jgi:hypothetical protein
MRILCSARDIGSYKQLDSFIDLIFKKKNIDFIILAQEPAYSYARRNAKYKKKYLFKIFSKDLKNKSLEIFFDNFLPNFVLTGLSSFSLGIDEILRKIANKKKIPSGAIQDYWGYLGITKNVKLPDYFFVIDETAKKLTLSRLPKNCSSKIIVTGSPKHFLYKKNIKNWKIRYNEKKTVHLFLQLLSIPGILQNYISILNALSSFDNKCKIFIHKHPSDLSRDCYKIAEKKKIKYYISRNSLLETDIFNADLVITFFSTVGLDHNYMYSISKKPIGELIYVNIGNKIRHYINKIVGVPYVPGGIKKYGITIYNKKKLYENIKKFMEGKKLNTYSALSIKKLKFDICPSKKILNILKKLQEEKIL